MLQTCANLPSRRQCLAARARWNVRATHHHRVRSPARPQNRATWQPSKLAGECRREHLVVVERADDRQRLRLAEHGGRYLTNLIVGDGFYLRQDLLDGLEP